MLTLHFTCLYLNPWALVHMVLHCPVPQVHQIATRSIMGAVQQEAAKGLQEKLGDPTAVVLVGCPEEHKVAIVVSLSSEAVKKVLRLCTPELCAG